MTERTTVEFTQAGKRITFSAGYIVGISPFGMRVSGADGKEVHLKCSILTNLGVVFVDQEYHQAYPGWLEALAAPDPLSVVMQFAPPQQPLGNDAEF